MISYFDTHVLLDLKVAAALVAFTSKDTTRPHLGVGLDQGSLCATDGHRAVAFEPCADALWCTRTQGRVWPRAHVETLVKVARAQKQDSIQLSLDHALPADGARMPPIWRVIPDYELEPKRNGAVGVDPAYLADLGKVAKACDCKGVQLSGLRSALDPLGFTVAGPAHTARIAIMPMRV